MNGWLVKGIIAGVVTYAIIKVGENMIAKRVKNNMTATMGVRG